MRVKIAETIRQFFKILYYVLIRESKDRHEEELMNSSLEEKKQ